MGSPPGPNPDPIEPGRRPPRGRVSPAARAWVERSAGKPALHIEPILGGTWASSELYRIHFSDRRLVLRMIVDPAWLATEPDLARHEAAALERAEAVPIATPSLVAFDASGDACGHPAVLMTELEGAVWIPPPASLTPWLEDLAGVALRVHAVEPAGFAWRYRSWVARDGLEPPPWSAQPELWQGAIELSRAGPPQESAAFLHRDYHPMNLLWQRGRPCGVVDWVNACVGPRSADLAHCRGNLLAMFGVDAADAFLDAYLRAGGMARDAYPPFWDVEVALATLPGPPAPYAPWAEHGLVAASGGELVARIEALLARALAAHGASLPLRKR